MNYLILFGTIEHRFYSLETLVIELVNNNFIEKNNVVIQAGHSYDFLNRNLNIPKNKMFVEVNSEILDKHYLESDRIITHCGTGSVFNSIKHNKPFFVLPRLVDNGEHIDNHQVELYRHIDSNKLGAIANLNNIINDSIVYNNAQNDIKFGKLFTMRLWKLIKEI